METPTEVRTSAHLRCKDLAKRFGPRLLFRSLTFELAGGESLAITGSNGSGKSTLLRILAGVLRPTAGKVQLRHNDRPVQQEQRPLLTGFVAPYLNVYDGLSARENLQFIARMRQLPQAGQRIDMLLEQVGLLGRGEDLVATFSSGMKQRVKFAAALLADPPLLLLDEPASNLDIAGLEMVSAVGREHCRSGGLLVVATNDPDEAERYDRKLCVEDFSVGRR